MYRGIPALPLALSAIALSALNTFATEVPCTQIRLITPYPPGGATDVASRLIAKPASKQ